MLLLLYVLVVHIDTEHVIFSLFFDTISLVMFSNGYVDRFHHGHVTINNENFQRNISCIVTLTGEIGIIPLGLTCSALLNKAGSVTKQLRLAVHIINNLAFLFFITTSFHFFQLSRIHSVSTSTKSEKQIIAFYLHKIPSFISSSE